MWRRPRCVQTIGSLCLALLVIAGAARAEGIGEHLGRVLSDGDTSLYLSGYAYHLRNNYSPRVLARLNEDAWGGGIGRTLALKDGGVASIAFTAFRDSIDDWEYTLGYMREWRWAPFHGDFKVGAGLAGFLTSRPDFFGGIPFPAVLPQATVAFGGVTVIGTYVPRLPEGGRFREDLLDMNGDVVYVWARVDL